ncbi:hypothetical protein FD755_018829, partial [Muntiacus reevesi]
PRAQTQVCRKYREQRNNKSKHEDAAAQILNVRNSTRKTTCPADVFFHFRQPHKNLRSHSMYSLKSAWAQPTCRFWCFPNLLGIKVNNSITRDSGQPGFVRGCAVGRPTTVGQTLDHPECL